MSDEKVKEGLEQCNLCNVALVSAIKERVDRGESVNAVCQDYEDFQRQLHGEVLLSRQALRDRYRRALGIKEPTYVKKSFVETTTPDKETPTEGFEFRQEHDYAMGKSGFEKKKKTSGSMEYVSDEQKSHNELKAVIRTFKGNIMRIVQEYEEDKFEFPVDLFVEELTSVILAVKESV